MSLRARFALLFGMVALITGLTVALTVPAIVGRGFTRIQSETSGGPGTGRGPGTPMGIHAQEIQQETIQTVIAVAVIAAAGASLLGFILAHRIVGPLEQLGAAAAAVARGDLRRRSGLASRTDEIGSLGRSFDAMADTLESEETARRRFFQDAAHELKTPLAVISATANAVLDGVYTHDDRHLVTIRDQSRLLARLVDDLRVIGLAEAGNLPMARDPIAVASLLATTRDAHAARAEAARIQLTMAAEPGLTVTGDEDRLRQVLAALVDNALRVTPAGGVITLEGALLPRSEEGPAELGADDPTGGARIRLAVRDSGPGVDPVDLPHLFDRFYQADPARDRGNATSGLGLAIVRALVEAHGGRVGAENPPGGGARFWVELPAADSAVQHQVPA